MAGKAIDIDVVAICKLRIFFSFIRSAYSLAGPTGSGKTSLTSRFVSTCIIFASTEMGIFMFAVLLLSTSTYGGGTPIVVHLIGTRQFIL